MVFIYDVHGKEKSKELDDFIGLAKHRYSAMDETSPPHDEADEKGEKKCCCFPSPQKPPATTNLSRASGHNRAQSMIAWSQSIASPDRGEAGFETSKLLLREKSQLQDQMERQMNTARYRAL